MTLRKSSKIVIGFGGTGFVLPLVLLTFYGIADHFGRYPSTDPLPYLCPSSILSMALAFGGSLAEGLIVWLLISISNALLYAALPLAIVLVYRVFRPSQSAQGLQLW